MADGFDIKPLSRPGATLGGRAHEVFREVNGAIRKSSVWSEPEPELHDFICECRDEKCVEVVRLTLAEFDSVDALADHFVVGPDHKTAPADELTFSNPRFAVVNVRPPAA